MRRTRGEFAFQTIDVAVMVLLLAVIIFPYLNIIALSVSDLQSIINRKVTLWPRGLSLDAYGKILGNPSFIRAMVNTIGITVVGAFGGVFFSLMIAYAFTRDFLGKKLITYLFVLTMYFSGGLIPTYIVYTNLLHLRNTFVPLVAPAMISMFHIIVIRSQIDALPPSISDAGRIDGCGEYQMVFRIVAPMITPTIAAISMFKALSYWNSWFECMVYTEFKNFWTLQYFLRVVVFDNFLRPQDETSGTVIIEKMIPPENFRMAAIILVAAPIIMIYPFVQKYFVAGILTGSVKE